MTTNTVAVSRALRLAGVGALGAFFQAEVTLKSARSAAESVAADGPADVIANLAQAVDSLEGVVEELELAELDCAAAAGLLDQITELTPQAEQQLMIVLSELEDAQQSLEAAVDLTDDAIRSSAAAGQQSLAESLRQLLEAAGDVLERVEEAFEDVEDELEPEDDEDDDDEEEDDDDLT